MFRKPHITVAGYRVYDVSFADFLNVLSEFGYENVAGLSKMPVNPLKWSKKEWDFVYVLIGKALRWPVEKVKHNVTKAPVILQLFNASLAMCGLTVLATSFTKPSVKKSEKEWDTVFVNE